jgi:hypothetical protein
MSTDFIFGRDEELRELRERLQRRRGFLLHGPAGVGKSLLLRKVLPEFPDALYSDPSSSAQVVFRNIAGGLLQHGPHHTLGGFDREAVAAKSAVNLKGVVLNALRSGRYCIVLDHLKRPASAFAASMRQVVGWASTPIVAVGHSVHMEHIGSLQPFFPDRADRMEIRNFDLATAERFLRTVAGREGLLAENMDAFKDRVLDFSQGNPGTILALVQMAGNSTYRSNDHIKLAPLLIDFRLNWKEAWGR